MTRPARPLNNVSRSDPRPASAGGAAPSCVVPSALKSTGSLRAAVVGQKVLAGLAKARACAAKLVQARTRALEAQVLNLAAGDIARGNRAWGRAGRIQRNMGSIISERHTK